MYGDVTKQDQSEIGSFTGKLWCLEAGDRPADRTAKKQLRTDVDGVWTETGSKGEKQGTDRNGG